MENAKRKIISFWLTHIFLRRIGKHYPEYFTRWIKDITDDNTARKIMAMRYTGDKYAELDRDVLGISSTLQQVMANQNQCCCSTLRAIDGVNYANAQNTAAINANTTAAVQKVLDAISANKVEALQGRINQLELNNAVAGVVRYPMATTYTSGVSPFCNCNSCGCGF